MSERMQAILAQHCPVCLQGPVFRSSIFMHESCPVCAIRFEREQGYFMGALYVAHALTLPLLSALTLLGWLLGFSSVSSSLLVATIIFVPAAPSVFRYSRVIWMHLDQLIDPRPETLRGRNA